MKEKKDARNRGAQQQEKMKGKTFALLFLFLIIMSLIIPCLGAASKKTGKEKGKEKEKAPVNKQREKDKQVKKDIREWVCCPLFLDLNFFFLVASIYSTTYISL